MDRKREKRICIELGKSHPNCLSPLSFSGHGTSVRASANGGDNREWMRLGHCQVHPIPH